MKTRLSIYFAAVVACFISVSSLAISFDEPLLVPAIEHCDSFDLSNDLNSTTSIASVNDAFDTVLRRSDGQIFLSKKPNVQDKVLIDLVTVHKSVIEEVGWRLAA